MMLPGQFKINGSWSEEFNTFMRERPQRISAGRVVELRERPGGDSIVLDYAYYKNVEWKISCNALADDFDEISHHEDRIREWLDMSSYSDFTYSFDPQYIYQVIVTSPPVFTGTHKDGRWIPFEFTISLRPFKMARTGLDWKHNPQALISIEKYPSKPKIQILGSGDITFWINDQKFELTNVGDEIIIDSQLEESYRIVDGILEDQDHKTKFMDFPILEKGRSDFRWTGNVKEFNIQPRWRTKV